MLRASSGEQDESHVLLSVPVLALRPTASLFACVVVVVVRCFCQCSCIAVQAVLTQGRRYAHDGDGLEGRQPSC